MYYAPKEHNPPNIHTYYQDVRATFGIENAEMLEGKMPTRQKKIIMAWIEIHKDELLANWQLYQNGEKPFKIAPLK